MLYEISVSVCVKLADTPANEEKHGNSSEPPSYGNACGEARYNQQNRSDDVADNG